MINAVNHYKKAKEIAMTAERDYVIICRRCSQNDLSIANAKYILDSLTSECNTLVVRLTVLKGPFHARRRKVVEHAVLTKYLTMQVLYNYLER